MLNFCTLFNSRYLSRGLAMYHSLKAQCPAFTLYIFAFDDKCGEVLRQLALPGVVVISLREFEDEDLLRVKPDRTPAEYCWTSTPATILYCIKQYALGHCTYIDADLLFYSNPQVLMDEMGGRSVLITEHRYTPEYAAYQEPSGKYCVQYMTFKNTSEGMMVLQWWRDACIEWCYNRVEDHKFGDQKYLDDWTTRFSGVHELQHLGGGVAPWNVQQYEVNTRNGRLQGKEICTGKKFEFVFFHFHALKFYEDAVICFAHYRISAKQRELIYVPYLEKLEEARHQIRLVDDSFDPHGASGPSPYQPFTFWLKGRMLLGSLKKFLRSPKEVITLKKYRDRVNTYNFYKLKSLIHGI
jgi:hypothetical protein